MNFDSNIKSPITEATDIIMNIPFIQPKQHKTKEYYLNQYLVVLTERLIKGLPRSHIAKLLNKSITRIMQIEYKLKHILSKKMKGYKNEQ
tara:strand:+ start:183 stop:452 length:270 start_codon:yes stop_codon:yes gene_type:complete